MRTLARFLLRIGTGWLLLFCVATAGSAASTNDIRFTFVEPPIVPAGDLPREARRAGITAEPDAHKGKAANIEFGIVRDPKVHGALSNIVAGHITAVAVTWADTNRFKTHEQTETILRRLLSAPTGSYHAGLHCSTYTYVPWSQLLGRPSIAARVEHTDGKRGQLLLFASGQGYLFAYKDREAKWWFGEWTPGIPK